jgi:hypothetical protein
MRAIDTRGWLMAASLAGVGCHDEPRLQAHTEPALCVSPDRQVGATCVPPGVQDDGCEAGARLIDGACEAVIAARCPPGEVPVVGSEACEALMDCGTGTWGDLPIDASTQHVDGAYGGGDSDGSAARPWITIGAAVGAAVDGARVVVAAGSYAEDVVIENKRIALWGAHTSTA